MFHIYKKKVRELFFYFLNYREKEIKLLIVNNKANDAVFVQLTFFVQLEILNLSYNSSFVSINLEQEREKL